MIMGQTQYGRLKQARLFILRSDLQILDIKHLAELETYYKTQCLLAIKTFKRWKKYHQDQTDVIEIVYGGLEGLLLRRHAEQSVQTYWMVRQDLRDCLSRYIAGCTRYPGICEKAA